LGRVSRLSTLYDSVETLVMSNATGVPNTSTGSSALSLGVTLRAESASARPSQTVSLRRVLRLSERPIDERPEDGRLVAQQLLFDLHRARIDDQVQRRRVGARERSELIIRIEHHGVIGVERVDPRAEIAKSGWIALGVLKKRAHDAQALRGVLAVLFGKAFVLAATSRTPHGRGVDQDRAVALAAGGVVIVCKRDRLQ